MSNSFPQNIFILIDGIPFDVVREMHSGWSNKKYFSFMKQPQRFVSCFPSMTVLSYVQILGLGRLSGYQDYYFDNAKGEVVPLVSDMRHLFTYPDYKFVPFFDFIPNQTYAEGAIFPWQATLKSFDKLTDRLLTGYTRKKNHLSLIWNADNICHLLPNKRIYDFMDEVEKRVLRIKSEIEKMGKKVRIIIFSDHGHSLGYDRLKYVNINEHLKIAGFVQKQKINRDNFWEISIPTNGNIGFATIYCNRRAKETIAEQLTLLDGVEHIAFMDDKSICHVLKRNGSIERGSVMRKQIDNDRYYKYEVKSGDPFKIKDIYERLLTTENDFVEEDLLFKATAIAPFPDPCRRIYTSLTDEMVINPADVIVSIKNGYSYGDYKIVLLSKFWPKFTIKSTHGNLSSEQSTGFIMSSDDEFPSPIYSQDFIGRMLKELEA